MIIVRVRASSGMSTLKEINKVKKELFLLVGAPSGTSASSLLLELTGRELTSRGFWQRVQRGQKLGAILTAKSVLKPWFIEALLNKLVESLEIELLKLWLPNLVVRYKY